MIVVAIVCSTLDEVITSEGSQFALPRWYQGVLDMIATAIFYPLQSIKTYYDV